MYFFYYARYSMNLKNSDKVSQMERNSDIRQLLASNM